MRLKITFVIISSILFLGCPKENPDAIRCVHVWQKPEALFVPPNLTEEEQVYYANLLLKYSDAFDKSLLDSYWTCQNMKTGEKKNVPLREMHLCLVNQGECKWTGTDVLEYEKIKNFYKDKCKVN